ncbi:MAG: tetratricopeptide repeat protein [Deltaproteobacteria bacterium]|nr:tetratricopeptide repeat protein [Deltaproteobacteria bacterium]
MRPKLLVRASLAGPLRLLCTLACAIAFSCAAGKPTPTQQNEVATLVRDAQADLADGHLPEAQKGFEGALAREPGNLAALRGRVETSRRLGLLSALATQAESLARDRPEWAPAHFQLGLVRFAQGDGAAARVELARAVELAPNEADLHYRLGIVLFDSEKFADAKGPLSRAVELAPRVVRYRTPLATCLDRLGDHKGAVNVLREIPRLSPTADEAALAQKASRVITDPFRGVPPAARPELETGLALLLRDAPGNATPILEGLLQKFPDLGAAHALLGLAAQRLDESGRAVSELTRASELSPDAPQPYAYLGELYAGKDRPELAEKAWLQALDRDPLDVATLRKLGQLRLDKLNNATGAIDALSQAAALQPADDALQLLLARTELAGGQAVNGRARLERLADKHGDDAEILLRLALALFDERKDAPPARKVELGKRVQDLTDKVLSLQPDNTTASRLRDAVKG